ncbi:Triose-phosphate Transporter [Dissophora ornata]|nr:Triose-phosphate Transporter [Dissophora ornata]
MTDPSHGLISAERSGESGAAVTTTATTTASVAAGSLQDPFGDDEAPFLQDHTYEHESFIDATADSYNSTTSRNPFADSNEIRQQRHDGVARDSTATTGYDSYDSQDEDDEDYDSDDADSDYTCSSSEEDGENGAATSRSRSETYRAPADGEDEDDVEEDTHHLLLTSNNSKLGGMGMGMRVGETGTGTMIGLDLEPHGHRRLGGGSLLKELDDNEYDTLPLSTIDVERLRMESQRGKHGRSSKHNMDAESKERRALKVSGGRKGRKKLHHRSGHDKGEVLDDEGTGSKLGLGAIRVEQVAALARKQFRVQMLWSSFYVFAWYSTSTALSFYNKWLFSPNYHNFQFPLFTTSLHMVAQFSLSSITLAILPALRPKAAPSAKDFGLEKPTWSLVGVIAVICVGLFMMVMSEADFVLIGFIQVMLAAVLGGLRWSLTQLLLEKTATKSGSLANPISTIFFLSPIMGICLSIVAGIFEGYGTIFSSSFFSSPQAALGTLGLLFLGGFIAFVMVLAEFNLISRTSVVTLSVLGIVKEVITVLVSAAVFHDQLTLVNVLGLFVTLTGIGVYHFMKLREMKAKARRDAKELADAESAKRKRRRDAKRLSKKQLGTSEPDRPWNHSLASHVDAAGASKEGASLQEAFILEEDDDFPQHGK